jgi:hypothetical protein
MMPVKKLARLSRGRRPWQAVRDFGNFGAVNTLATVNDC